MRTTSLVLAVLVILAAGSLSLAAERIAKGKYQSIEITKFDIKQGVQFPPEYQVSLVEDLVKQLENSKKFKQVLRPGETPADPNQAGILLKGTVTEYKPGSRAKRYLVGFGAGATKVVAQVQFVDRASGAVLLDRKVDGKVIMGVIGGQSMGATNGLAKEVAKVTKEQFF